MMFLKCGSLLMLGERRLSREHLVEEEFPRLRDVLVNLELLHARLLPRLRKKILQKVRNRAFLTRIDFPERGDDQALVDGVGSSHVVLL